MMGEWQILMKISYTKYDLMGLFGIRISHAHEIIKYDIFANSINSFSP